MVLGGENHARKSRFLGHAYPLRCVEVGGVEEVGVGVAGAPLGVREGVWAEVEEEGHVAELPLELGSRRDGQNGKRWRFD